MNRRKEPSTVVVSPHHFFLFSAPIWSVFFVCYDVQSNAYIKAYIKCWSCGDVCITAKACGADGPLGKNPPEVVTVPYGAAYI